MLRQIGEKEFDFNCKLGVTVRIKSKFKKSYNQVVEDLDKMDTVDMVSLLYCGLKQDQISESEFTNYVFENCGMGDLTDAIAWFIKQIQYPGLSEDEIEKKLQEKRAMAKKYNLEQED